MFNYNPLKYSSKAFDYDIRNNEIPLKPDIEDKNIRSESSSASKIPRIP